MIFYDFGTVKKRYPKKMIHDMEIGVPGQAWCIISESDGLTEMYNAFEG